MRLARSRLPAGGAAMVLPRPLGARLSSAPPGSCVAFRLQWMRGLGCWAVFSSVMWTSEARAEILMVTKCDAVGMCVTIPESVSWGET